MGHKVQKPFSVEGYRAAGVSLHSIKCPSSSCLRFRKG